MLEMIFAVTLFATVVVALMGVWAMHARAVGRARNTLLAGHLAERVMEQALSQGWQVKPIPASDATRMDMTSILNGERVVNSFQYSVDVDSLGNGTDIGLKQVRVVVKWTEADQQSREVDLDTIIYWQG